MSDRAQGHIDGILVYISQDSPRNAAGWLKKLSKKIQSLRRFPRSNEVLPELDQLPISGEYRHLLFGNYRIVYHISEDIVAIDAVVHAAQILKPRHFPDVNP